jgi:hypothetical protein
MMSPGGPPNDDEDGGGGYSRPPKTKRFKMGQSGNPAGRTRGRRREAPYEAVLGQMVTIREGGVERRVTAAEAFLLHLTKRGLEGDSAASRASLTLIEKASEQTSAQQGLPSVIVRIIVAPGSVTSALDRCESPRNLIPTARPHVWPSNLGSSRPRWPACAKHSTPSISEPS